MHSGQFPEPFKKLNKCLRRRLAGVVDIQLLTISLTGGSQPDPKNP